MNPTTLFKTFRSVFGGSGSSGGNSTSKILPISHQDITPENKKRTTLVNIVINPLEDKVTVNPVMYTTHAKYPPTMGRV